MKKLMKLLIAVFLCSISINSIAQFNAEPKTICDIVSFPIDEMDVITVGTVTDTQGNDKFDLTYDGCTVLCDGDFGYTPIEGMLIVVEGRVQEEDLFEDLTINVRYWVPYEEEPPGWSEPIVFTAEDAVDADEGTVALLFGKVQNYSDEDEGLGTFLDGTGSVFIDFPDGDSPAVQENVYVLGVMELNNAENPILSVTYWYPEGGNPPPPPPPIAWHIVQADSLPVGTFCFIQGAVTSWSGSLVGVGEFDDGNGNMDIIFVDSLGSLPELNTPVYVLGVTIWDGSEIKILAHHWMEEFSVGTDESVTKNSELRIFPNPGFGKIYIDSRERISRIVINNIVGEVVKEINQFEISTINVSDLKSGIYIISFIGENEYLVSKRLVIK